MKQESCFDVILAAGGSGRRFGGEKNKVLTEWQGKPLLRHCLDLFGAYPGVQRVVIPCREEDRPAVLELTAAWLSENGAREELPAVMLAEGGRERQDSVRNALALCREEWVLIHDGARPFATAAVIKACLEALKEYPAVTAGVPSKDTVKLVNEKNEVVQTTDRSRTWLIQTPQGFWTGALKAAHGTFRDFPVTDDCGLMELAGHKVKVVPGDYKNIKITTQEDLM